MAADVITRFKLETTQFDSKLRDTAKALQDIARTAANGGKDFNNFSQKAIDTARALGTVASGATNTKDRLRDLVGSYNDAVKAYDKLSDAAKKGEFGQAMDESLRKLQLDIKNTKEELYSLGDAVGSKSGSLFGENGFTGMLQVFGGNMLTKGVEALTSKLTEAWTQSIELARQGEGVRIAFERLNQPGLLDRLKEATHGTVSEMELMKQAIKFENFKLPLEDLATYLAFAQQKAKDTGESVDYMVNSITTGLGRQSKQILDNLGISAAELTKRMNEGADMTKAVAEIIREEMAKAGDYVETAADRAAQAAAKATDEMEAFGRQAAPIAEEFNQIWNTITIGAMKFANTLLGPVAESIRFLQDLWNNGWEERLVNNPYNIEGKSKTKFGYQGMGDLQKVTAPGGYVEVTDRNTGAVIGGQHFDNLDDKNAIKDWQKSLFKKTKTGSSSKNQPEYLDFYKALFKNESMDLKKEAPFQSVFDMMKDNNAKFDPESVLGQKDSWDNMKDTITGTIGSIGESFDNLTSFTKNFDPYQNFLDQQQEKLNGLKKGWQMAASAINLAGNAMSGLKNPAIDIMTVIGQAVATIGLAYAQTLAEDSQSKSNIYAFIAAAAAATISMATTIASLHSATGYAQGGEIKGNSYSGDNIGGLVDGSQLVGLNAGEIVLNHAQQANLANSLQGGGFGNMQIVGVLDGEKIKLCLNRHFKRSGEGELVTWGGH